jgi:hypothetical protein
VAPLRQPSNTLGTRCAGIDDIQEIPDLDDAGGPDEDKDITKQVADAPNVISSKIQTLQDLDHDAMFNLPSSAQVHSLMTL